MLKPKKEEKKSGVSSNSAFHTSLKRLYQNSIYDPKGQRLLVYRQNLFVATHVWKDEGMEAGQRAGVSFFFNVFVPVVQKQDRS